jgi:hypothetical protein
VLGRRSGATRFEPEPAVPVAPTRAPAGKGRPTPRRRDAEAERLARVRPPKSKREAAQRRRERMRVERDRTRQAMITGDERGMPRKDRGIVRRFVRDTVDAQSTPLQFALPVMAVLLVASTVVSSAIAKKHPDSTLDVTFAFYFVVLAIIGFAVAYGFRLRKIVAARFADTGEDTTGAIRYGVFRAATMRRLRMPKPTRR